MTELAIRDDRRAIEIQQPRLSAGAPSSAITTLADWEAELLAAGSIATKLCNTPFVPRHFQGKPADAAAAILTGFELGLSPMAALRSIFMISGTPGMYAKVMVAVVQAQGHHVWIEEQSKDRVIVCGRRRDWPEDIPDARTVWDLERVKTAELLSNAQYKKNPQQMMKARGQAEICREIASDALTGIPYSVEELESIDSPVRAEIVATAPVTAAEILGTAPASEQPAIEQQQTTPEPQAPARPSNLPLPLAERVARAVVSFSALGVSAERIEAKLGRSRADWTEHDMAALQITHQSLKNKEIDGDAEFPPVAAVPTDSFVDTSGPMEPKQRSKMFALFGKFDDLANRHEQLAYIADKLGYEVESRGALTASEAAIVIDKLESYEAQEQPPAGDPV